MTGIFFYCLFGLLVLSLYRLYDDEIEDYDIIHHYFISITSRKRFMIFLRFLVFILWPIFAIIEFLIFIFWFIKIILTGLFSLFFKD